MLQNQNFFSGFSVKDSKLALEFYQNKLGLNVIPDDEMEGMFTIKNQDTSILVYPKENHEPATFTILNFVVDDIVQKISEMKAAGIVFESYDSDSFKTDSDNIFRGGGPLIAWFKDPSGNILSVMEG